MNLALPGLSSIHQRSFIYSLERNSMSIWVSAQGAIRDGGHLVANLADLEIQAERWLRPEWIYCLGGANLILSTSFTISPRSLTQPETAVIASTV
jgi:hypothetical protein